MVLAYYAVLWSVEHQCGNEDAVRESNRPYQSEPADTGLASLLLLQSHLDTTLAPPTDDILSSLQLQLGV